MQLVWDRYKALKLVFQIEKLKGFNNCTKLLKCIAKFYRPQIVALKQKQIFVSNFNDIDFSLIKNTKCSS